MARLTIYPTPLDADCRLDHDAGFSVMGIAGVDSNGRSCQYFDLWDTTPDGWGARITLTHPLKTTMSIRGRLIYNDHAWWLFADDFIMTDLPTPIVRVVETPTIPPAEKPKTAAEIIQMVASPGKFDLATKEGCGKFTEECYRELRRYHSSQWRHIRKSGAQNQYNGHAVDALMLMQAMPDCTEGVYDLIFSSESSDARATFNRQGPADPDRAMELNG